MKLTFYQPNPNEKESLPLFSSSVQAGFPSPAENFLEKQLDLNDLLIDRPAATFYVRVVGDSMDGAKISNGDILIVDRSKEPISGKIILAIVNGEFTVKEFHKKDDRITLFPKNPNYPPLHVTEEMDFLIWGVVTYIIHKCP